MKLRTALLSLLIAVAPAAGAAGPLGAPGQHEGAPPDRRFFNALAEALKLRGDQEAPVKGVLDAGRGERQAIMQQHREQMDALHARMLQRLAGVLDAEQLARFDAFMRGARLGGPGRGGPGMPPR